MPDGGITAMAVAVGVIKLGAAHISITGIITGVKVFHTYDYKVVKKKGGKMYDVDQFEDVRERLRPKY